MLRCPVVSVLQTGRSATLRRSISLICLFLVVFPSCVQRRVVTPQQAGVNAYKPTEPRNLSEYIRSVMKLSYGERKSTTQSSVGTGAPTAGVQADTANAVQGQAAISGQIQMAIANRKAGSCLAAFEQLDALEKIVPENPLVQLQLGLLWNDWANYPRACAHAQRAIAIKPDMDEAWELLGRANLQTGKYTAAVEAYRKALGCGLEIAARRANLGFALMRAGMWADAEGQLRRALDLDERIVEARNNLGVTLVHLGKCEEAFSEFVKVSEPAVAFNNVGIVLRERKLWPEALAAFRQALDLKPDYQRARLNLAEMNAYLPPPPTVYLPAFPSPAGERQLVQAQLDGKPAASADSSTTATGPVSLATQQAPAPPVAAAYRAPGSPLPPSVSIRWLQDPVAAADPKMVALGPKAEPVLRARLTQPAALSLPLDYDLSPPPTPTHKRLLRPGTLEGELQTIARELSRSDAGTAVPTALVSAARRRIERITALNASREPVQRITYPAFGISEPDSLSVLDSGTIDLEPSLVMPRDGTGGIRALRWQGALQPGAFQLGFSLAGQRTGQYEESPADTAPPVWLGALTIVLLFALALVFFGLPLAAAVLCIGLLAWLGIAVAPFL